MHNTMLRQSREILLTVNLLRERLGRRMLRKQAQQPSDNSGAPEFTMPQFHAMLAIHEQGEVTIKELAELLCVSSPSASTMVDRLVEMRMAAREQSQEDRREVRVRLTATGISSIHAHEEHLLEAISDLLKKMGPDLSEQWCEVYRKIREIVLADRDDEPLEGTK